MRLPLAIASLVILVIHGFVFYNQFFHKWENYQTAYFDQAKSLAKTDVEKAALDARRPRIEQALVTQFGDMRVDRCGTCHIAMDDPRFNQHAHPLRTHPYSVALGDFQQNGKWERRHKFSDFGCTVCHDGQGRGLKTEYSHGEDEYWPEPLTGYVVQAQWRKEFQPHLKGKEYLQVNCVQCHTEDTFAGTPLVAQGRKIFFARNCYGCHKIEGLSDGTIGPDLTEAGKKFRVDYLWESVVDPRANLATSIMPKFNLSDDEVKALVVFLKSRRGINFAETGLQRYRAVLNVKKPQDTDAKEPALTGAALVSHGQQLINDRACTACHRLGGADGGISPDLGYEGLIRDEEWLFDHFKNPRSRVADSIMPSFRFVDADFRAMSAYLASLRTPAPANLSAADSYKTMCQRCHGEKGDGHGTVAWYLDPYPRDLTKAGFVNSKTTERLTNSIRKGVAGTSMPAWGNVMKDDQINGVLQYVFTTFTKDPRREFKPHNVPETNPVAMSEASAMLNKADKSATFAVAASLVFFFIGAILTTVVPPLVDKSWSKPFENSDPAKGPTGKLKPYTEIELRGRAVYVREGCWYCHTQQTRTLLSDTIRSGWKGVRSPISTPDEFVYDSPHMFGTKRTGPDLSRVGGKYDTQWHRTHFRNPRDLVPGSVMPPFPWIVENPKEFEGMVAYLQTLGRAKDWRPNGDYEK